MYFGSVRFFKNLIFLAVCVLILIPSLLAVKYHREVRALEQTAVATFPLGDDGISSGETLFEPENQPTDAASFTDGIDFSEQIPLAQEPEPAADPVIPAPSDDPPAYQLLYGDFYAPQPYGAMERLEHTAYLTFDDGPSDRTDEVLAILAEKNVKATFFVTGKEKPEDLARMKKIVDEGHTIGMHSYSHDYAKVYASVESFLDEFYRIFKQIQETTGVTPTVFRFPGGSINGYDGGFYQEIISEMIRRGFVPYDWNVSSEDAATHALVPAQTLVDNVVRNASGKVRAFILFHDSEQKTTSVHALGPVIDQLQGLGFTFEAITPTTLPVLYSYTY